MSVQKLVVVTPNLIIGITGDKKWTANGVNDELRKVLDPNKPIVVGVVPTPTAVVTASGHTLDAAVATRFPPAHTFVTEPIGENQFQAFAIEDELLDALRALGKDVRVAPYAAALRQTIGVSSQGRPRRKTSLFRAQEKAAPWEDSGKAISEVVVIEPVRDEFLLTALRGSEVLAMRFVHGGDPLIELERTAAATRMSSPRVLCVDREILAELQAKGYHAEPIAPRAGLLVGWFALEELADLRFRTAEEVAHERSSEQRRKGRLLLASTSIVAAVAVTGTVTLWGTRAALSSQRNTLQKQQQEMMAQITQLYADRYPAIARRASLTIHDEMFDLLLSLPPQVVLLSLIKEGTGISAVIERRVDAAPFTRGDLEAALAASPYFGKATIREEYQGTVIRYNLTIRTAGAPVK